MIASRFKQSKVKRYFDQFCQIWDDYMWVTPEKGQLVMIADICWEQDVHTIGYNNQMADKKNLKPMGFLWTKQCYKTCKVTYDPNQSPQWPGRDWRFNPGIRWIAPNGTHWLCGTNLWPWLPPGWIGRCTVGLAFAHGNIRPTIQEPLNLPSQGPDGHDWFSISMIIWLLYLFLHWALKI